MGALARARGLAQRGADEDAKQAYMEVLQADWTHFDALTELGALANASGHVSAARLVQAQAARCHPGNAVGRVNFGDALYASGDLAGARVEFEAALAVRPDYAEAHQGLARVLAALGDPAAEGHFRAGFAGHAVFTQRFRGEAPGVKVLLLACARGGNVPTKSWIDNRVYAVTGVYADCCGEDVALPAHDLIVNAVGDADFCAAAVRGAAAIVARSGARVINHPHRVALTGRVASSRRLGRIDGVVTPRIALVARAELTIEGLAARGFSAPFLLRAPGYHTGLHFYRIGCASDLAAALVVLPGDAALVIEFLDARGADGLARKYRAMFVGGAIYPLHLAISADWKVHYFSAAMEDEAAHRDEEKRFLDDMPGVLGERAMLALRAVAATLGLEYGGVDFGLGKDGSVIVFEANATMVVNPAPPEPMWDYRRQAIETVLLAAGRLLKARPGALPLDPIGAVAPNPIHGVRDPMDGGLGQRPQRGPGAEPLALP